MFIRVFSCCCCHELPYIFVLYLIVFRSGTAKEKLTFVSCQFALILSILAISNALYACCCCVIWHPCCCIVHVSLNVLRSFSLSPCSILTIRLRRGGQASCGIPALPGKFPFLGCWAFLLLLGLRKMFAIDWLVGPTSVVYFRIRLGFELGFVFGGRRARI